MRWKQHDVDAGDDVGESATRLPPLTDASMHVTDPGRYLYVNGGSGSIISRVYDHKASPDQCVMIYTWMTTGTITVEFWSAEAEYGEKLEKQDSFEIVANEGRGKNRNIFMSHKLLHSLLIIIK